MPPEKEIEVLFRGQYLSIAKRKGYEFVQRVNCSGVVVILAKTQDDCIILVEQYRAPIDARMIELPAGLVGDEKDSKDEDFEKAARRELIEETGFEAKSLKQIGIWPTTSGMSSEIVHIYRADGVRKVGSGGGVDAEDITVHLVPISKALAWLDQKIAEGLFIDPKVYSGLYLLGQAI